MGRVLRHFLTATVLLGTTTGQGNSGGLVGGLLNPITSAKLAVPAGASASINLNLGASPAVPSESVQTVAATSGRLNLNLNIGSGKTGTFSGANASPISAASGLLGGLGDTLNGVGGAVGAAVSRVGSAVIAIVTPVASGLQSVVSNAGQVVDAIRNIADSGIAAVPPIVSRVGSLLDVTLDTVSDFLTNVTLSLLAVSFFSLQWTLLTSHSRLPYKCQMSSLAQSCIHIHAIRAFVRSTLAASTPAYTCRHRLSYRSRMPVSQ